MRLFVAGLLSLGAVASLFHPQRAEAAQIRQFPYEAVVDAGTAFIHSGPGKKYYATNRLSQGERVVVHRHDPGGWYMIAPPSGSFSWIRADAIERRGEGRGMLIDNNVVVRVGSALDDSRDVFQARLSTGAEVEILGEQTIRTRRGPVQMLKIVPPQGEWRWIPGQAVTPVDESVRRRLNTDPYKVPSHARRDRQTDRVSEAPRPQHDYDGQQGPLLKPAHDHQHHDDDYVERPIVRSRQPDAPAPEKKESVHRRDPELESMRNDRDRLDQLDETFRTMIELDTSEWDFTELKQQYFELRDAASVPALASQVDVRLASLQRYEEIKANYDGFIRLTAKISRRDRRLMELQQEQLQAIEADNTVQPAPEPQETIIAHPVSSPAPQPQRLIPQPEPSRPAPRPRFVPTQQGPPQSAPGPQFAPPLTPHTSAEPPAPAIQPAGQIIHQSGPAFPGQAPAASIPASPASVPSGRFPGTVRQPRSAPAPQFNGAGIIQRAVNPNPLAPQHVLLDPNGRILAYLQGVPGVNLDRHVGRPMGVRGVRVQRPDLKMGLFIVQSLSPVNLQ